MGQFRGRVAAHGELVFGKTEAGSRLVQIKQRDNRGSQEVVFDLDLKDKEEFIGYWNSRHWEQHIVRDGKIPLQYANCK